MAPVHAAVTAYPPLLLFLPPIDDTTMQATLITAFTILSVLGLAAVVQAQRMVAVDSNRTLYDIDITTGAKTAFGTVSSNAGTTAGLAYDASTGTMYLTSTGNDSLYTLDLTTGTATLIGAYGNSALVMHGLEFDSSTGRLYGVSSHDNGLYDINKTTGVATLIGTSGLTSFTNLGYDSVNDVMYATNSGSDSCYIMNRATGGVTLVGPLSGPTNPNGLAFNTNNNTLYLVDNSTDNFYSIDTSTGAANLIGAMGSGNLLGLAWIPGSGSIVRQAHGCGGTTVNVSGLPNLGAALTTTLGNTTGVPFIGYGLVLVATPFCVCTVGHEWSVVQFGTTSTLNVPTNPIFTGISVGIQGTDFLGAGGCPAPQLTFTDTMVVTIG